MLAGVYSVFFSMSESPRVSRTMNTMKRRPMNENEEKYQNVPWTYIGLLIMYSKDTEMTKMLMNRDAVAIPVPASTQTSGT